MPKKVKHEKMLNGITGMYYWNESMFEVSNIIAEYQSMDIKDYTASYAEVVQLLNSNLTGDAGRNETDVEDSNDSTADAEEEKSAEEINDYPVGVPTGYLIRGHLGENML